jgi:N-acetylmuramoyl-L-alanine amidase
MGFTIKNHKLLWDNKAVEFIKSASIGAALPNPTRILVMHFTYGASARSSAEWFRNPANPGSSAHVVVDRNGSVIQCVPFDTIAWHARKSRWKELVGLNNHALSIEMANWDI